jgi:hypothetical protein
MATTIRLPSNSQHLAIVGRNGTGKTHAALWHLSQRDLAHETWVILDYKRERDTINAISGAQYLDFKDDLPEKPGVYILQPNISQVGEMDEFLYRIHAHENIGVFVDEGYMLQDNTEAFNALLTQGRSKHIPLIVLSQRPSWISRFVFSESTFYQVFALNDRRDRKTVTEFIDFKNQQRDFRHVNTLPEFHSYYYDVGKDQLTPLAPVPPLDDILKSIDVKLRTPEEREKEKKNVRRWI